LISLTVSACARAKLLLGLAVFLIVRIHGASFINKVLRINVMSATNCHATHKEIPFSASVAVTDSEKHLLRLVDSA
jgi:hypothetical protein